MGLIKGGFLRITQSLIYFLILCCSVIVLGIYAYFLASLSNRNRIIPDWEKAVEGLSGAAVVYTILATLLTCCLGGVSIFAILAIVMDLLFCGAMIAVAYFTGDNRHGGGAKSCNNYVVTPLGSGYANQQIKTFEGIADRLAVAIRYRTACRFNKAAFAFAIIAAVLFLITALMQIMLLRNHKKEKRSDSNDYNNGYSEKKRFGRRHTRHQDNLARDAELGTGAAVGAGGLAAHHHHNNNTRASRDTAMTGSTMAGHDMPARDKPVDTPAHNNLASAHPHDPRLPRGVAGTGAHAAGYNNEPQGTFHEPYGYEGTQPNYVAPDAPGRRY